MNQSNRFKDGTQMLDETATELAQLIQNEHEAADLKPILKFLRKEVWKNLSQQITCIIEKELGVKERALQFKYAKIQLQNLKESWEDSQNQSVQEYVLLLKRLTNLLELMEAYSPKYGPRLSVRLDIPELIAVLRECVEIKSDQTNLFGVENEVAQEQKENEAGNFSFIIQPRFGTNLYISYDLESKVGFEFKDSSTLPRECGFCHVGNQCFFGGGRSKSGKLTNAFYSIDKNGTLVDLKPFYLPERCNLAMCGFTLSSVITTGGRNDIALVVAQMFTILKNQWQDLPSMIHRRASHSLCAFTPHNAIYAFFGNSDTGRNVSSIECFKKGRWKLVEIEGSQLIPSSCMFSHELPQSPQIMLWSLNEDKWRTFKLNPTKGEEIECEEIEVKNSRQMSAVRIAGNRLVCSQADKQSLWEWKDEKWKSIISEFEIFN